MGDVYPKVKLAAAQAAPVWLNREATVQKACSLIEEAGRNGAQIVAFPEGYLPGFPDWFNWYMPRSPESIRFSKELIKNAIEVPSPATDELCAAARRAGTYVVMGMNERDPGTMGSLFNALLFISPEGEILGVHRKIVPTSTERLIHWFGDGTSLRTYETPYGALGGLICGENTNSLARFALLAQQERVHVAAWPAWLYTMWILWHSTSPIFSSLLSSTTFPLISSLNGVAWTNSIMVKARTCSPRLPRGPMTSGEMSS